MVVLVPKELRPPKRIGMNVALGWEPYGGLLVPNTGLKSVLSDAELPAAAPPCLAPCLAEAGSKQGSVDAWMISE